MHNDLKRLPSVKCPFPAILLQRVLNRVRHACLWFRRGTIDCFNALILQVNAFPPKSLAGWSGMPACARGSACVTSSIACKEAFHMSHRILHISHHRSRMPAVVRGLPPQRPPLSRQQLHRLHPLQAPSPRPPAARSPRTFPMKTRTNSA